MSQASETRKLYAFERMYIDPIDHEQRGEWPMWRLRDLAQHIWSYEAPDNWYPPEIKAGRGVKMGDKYVSYCLGRSEIVLARDQRFPSILVHEVAHALRNGDVNHNKWYTRRYFTLLVKYLDYNPLLLYHYARENGVAV